MQLTSRRPRCCSRPNRNQPKQLKLLPEGWHQASVLYCPLDTTVSWHTSIGLARELNILKFKNIINAGVHDW